MRQYARDRNVHRQVSLGAGHHLLNEAVRSIREDTMNYWQIATGALDRDYSDIFLRRGIAAVGNQIETMKAVSLGDCIVLKRGVKQTVAVGTVVARDGRFRGVGDKPWL